MNRLTTCLRASVTARLLLVLLVASPAIVLAREPHLPLAVELLRFELFSVSSGVEIQWETGTESDIAYFKIRRGPAPDGPYTDLTGIGLVEAMGSPVSGYAYTAIDETAAEGQSYSYQLVELTLSNEENVVAEGDITLGATPTPEVIRGVPPTSIPTPTTSTQTGTVTPQATGGATATLRPTTASNGSTRVAATATVSGTTSVVTPTRAAPTLGPTPTRFSFTPRPPVVATSSQTGAPVVEAAAPSALAQATSEPYPGPAEAQPTPLNTQVFTAQVGAPEQAPAAYPGGTLSAQGGLPSTVGAGVQAGEAAGTEVEDQAAEETSGTARLLLWLGFLAALFIFIGGIGFSIVLSTRRRENDLP